MPNEKPEPSKNTLLWCMDIATTAEASEYLAEKVEWLLGKNHQDLCKKFWDCADEVAEAARSTIDSWGGQATPKTAYQKQAENNIQHMERDAAELPEKAMLEVDVDINFTEEGQLKRAYWVDGKELEDGDPRLERMDTTIHGWLSTEPAACKDEVIYEADAHGHLTEDAQGAPIRIPVDELKDSLEDSVDGFKPYVKEQMFDTEVRELRITVPDELKLGGEGPVSAA